MKRQERVQLLFVWKVCLLLHLHFRKKTTGKKNLFLLTNGSVPLITFTFSLHIKKTKMEEKITFSWCKAWFLFLSWPSSGSSPLPSSSSSAWQPDQKIVWLFFAVFVRERTETFQIDDDYLVCVINGRFPFVNVTQVSCGGFWRLQSTLPTSTWLHMVISFKKVPAGGL